MVKKWSSVKQNSDVFGWLISAVNPLILIMNFFQVSPSFPHSDKLRELVYLGIPHSMRAPVSTDSA